MPTGVQRLSPSHNTVCRVDSSARMFLSLPSVHSRSCREWTADRDQGLWPPACQAADHPSDGPTLPTTQSKALTVRCSAQTQTRHPSFCQSTPLPGLGDTLQRTRQPAELRGEPVLQRGPPTTRQCCVSGQPGQQMALVTPCPVWGYMWSGLQSSEALSQPVPRPTAHPGLNRSCRLRERTGLRQTLLDPGVGSLTRRLRAGSG